jgi:tryptophan-rich sensory protein
MRRIHYILVPLFYAAVALSGRAFTSEGVAFWYPALIKPSFTPPGWLIGAVWTTIYILTALAFIVYVNCAREAPSFRLTAGLFVLNGVINALWSYVFFARHMLGLAVLGAACIFLTVAAIMALAWPKSKAAALLLLPYVLWTGFATFLSYMIYRLN